MPGRRRARPGPHPKRTGNDQGARKGRARKGQSTSPAGLLWQLEQYESGGNPGELERCLRYVLCGWTPLLARLMPDVPGATGNSTHGRPDTPVGDDEIELGLQVQPELRIDSEPVPEP